MSKKNKSKPPPTQSPIVDLLRKVQLHWARGDFAQAFLAARQCFTKEPTPQIRALLQEALLKYAEWLANEGRLEEAKTQFARLFESGDIAAIHKDAVVKVSAKLGVMASLPAEFREGAGTATLADAAVLEEQFELSILTEADAGDVRLVREALAAWDAGETERMREVLARIPRQSSLADWRLFLRGLDANVRGATEDAEASWSRLAPDRTPGKLAAAFKTAGSNEQLQTLIASKRENPKKAASAAAALAVLQRRAFGFDHVLEDVLAFFEHFGYAEYMNVLAMLERLGPPLRESSPEILRGFENAAYVFLLNDAIDARDQAYGKGFTSLLERLSVPIDPNRNRFWAIAAEQAEDGKENAAPYWIDYAADVPNVSAISDRNKGLAKSLVLSRAAGFDFKAADQIEDEDGPMEEILRLRKEGVVSCREAIKASPDRLQPYEQLAEHFEEVGDEIGAFELRSTMVERFPNHVDSLLLLASHPRLAKDAELALEYAGRAQRLKPLDSQVASKFDFIRLAAVRRFTIVGQSSRARELLAQKTPRNEIDEIQLQIHEALIAASDEDASALEGLVSQLQDLQVLGLAAGLMLAMEVRFYELGKSKVELAEQHWTRRLQADASPAAFAAAAAVVVPYLGSNPRAPAWKYKLANALAKSIKTAAAKRGPFGTASELRVLTVFAEKMPNQSVLFKSLLQRGVDEFRDDPYFAAKEGIREIELGPRKCNRRRAYDLLTRAKKRIEMDPNSPDAGLLPMIREQITFLDEVGVEDPFAGIGGRRSANPFFDIVDLTAKEMGISVEELMKRMQEKMGIPPDFEVKTKKK